MSCCQAARPKRRPTFFPGGRSSLLFIPAAEKDIACDVTEKRLLHRFFIATQSPHRLRAQTDISSLSVPNASVARNSIDSAWLAQRSWHDHGGNFRALRWHDHVPRVWRASEEGLDGTKVGNIRSQVDRFVFSVVHRVIVLASGRLLNLGCATGIIPYFLFLPEPGVGANCRVEVLGESTVKYGRPCSGAVSSSSATS